MAALPGLQFTELWCTEGTPALPIDGADPTPAMQSFAPGPGGTRFRLVRLPPESETMEALAAADPARVMQEFAAAFPGIGDRLEPQDPAMHRTESVDYGIVLCGEVWLELDDGAIVHLETGDCIVQNGTRHAWRNRADRPCIIAFILIGAESANG